MRILYNPTVNRIVRNALRPLSHILPAKARIPVTGTVRVTLPGGQSFHLVCNPTSYAAKALFWGGPQGFEFDVIRIFIEIAGDAQVFFDVGANIGYYSLVATAVQPEMRVVAFEPLPAAHAYLERNIAANGLSSVIAERLALSDHEGTTEFFASTNPKFHYIADQLTSTGSLVREQAHRGPAPTAYSVELATLDGYVHRHGIERVDVLKLDTEATEHLVLKGASNVLERHRPIIFCEVLPGRVEAEIEAVLSQHHYRAYRVGPAGLTRLDDLRHDRSTTNDHLMVHESETARIQRFVTAP